MYTNYKAITIFWACFVLLSGSSLAQTLKKEVSQKNTWNKPFVFVENKGQITNQYKQERKDIQYKLSSKNLDVFVGYGTLHYQFHQVIYRKNILHPKKVIEPTAKTYRVDVQFLGANKNPEIVATEQQEYRESYRLSQLGKKQITVHSYKKVTYRNIYPDIDWVLYTMGDILEYDFVVHPGGDVKNIKLKYKGATKLLSKGDNIAILSPMGNIKEGKLYSYEAETGREIASSFVLNKNILSFNTAVSKQTIIIDPQIEWGSYFGGSGIDQAIGTTADRHGNIYIVGTTTSISNIATVGSYQSVFGGGNSFGGDAFLSKFSPSGSLLWSTYFGGSQFDEGCSAVCDTNDYIYVTGATGSDSGIVTTGAYQTSYGGSFEDAFLAKFSSEDSLIWSTYYGGNGSDYGYAIACDANGDIYFGGSTGTTSLRTMYSTNGCDTSFNGDVDIFVAKFKNNGTRIWGTYYGGTSYDYLYQLATDAYGNVYGTGYTYSTSGIATPGAFKTTLSSSTLLDPVSYIVKIDSTSHLKWATYYGDTGVYGWGLLCDTMGSIYLSGYTYSLTGIATPNSYKTNYSGDDDIFLAKFDTAGRRLWGTFYGGSDGDFTQSNLTFDNCGNIILGGLTSSLDGIATSDAFQPSLAGSTNACISKFSPQGQLIWGSYYGGNFSTVGTGVIYTPTNGACYISGWASSTNGIAHGSSPYQPTFGGGLYDAFVAKIGPDTIVLLKQPYTDTILCHGGTWDVNYITSANFNSGNIFTVQLSDTNGNFASPVNIGSSTSITSGKISATIPASIPYSIKYRIRIVSTNPSRISPDDYYNIHITDSTPLPIVNNNSPICIGDSLKLITNTSNNIYSWTGPSGFTSTIYDPVIAHVTTSMAGQYTVGVTYPGCRTIYDSTRVIINSTFPASLSDSSNSPICKDDTIRLFSHSSTTGVSYRWMGPNNFKSTAANNIIYPAQLQDTGKYYIDVIYNNCKLSDSILIKINTPDTINIKIKATPEDTFCIGNYATFTATTRLAGTMPIYEWLINGALQPGILTSTWGSSHLANGDTVYCILISNAYCIKSSIDTSNKVIVNILSYVIPKVSVTASPDRVTMPGQTITFTATVTNGGTSPTFEWYKNGILIPGAITNPYITNSVNNGDVIRCTVVSNAQCVSPNTTTGSSSPLGIETTEGQSLTSIYPNPNNGDFTLKANFTGTSPKEVTVEVLNVVGQIVYHTVIATQNGSIEHNMKLNATLPNGIYVMRMTANNNSAVLHFSINK